MLHTQCHTKKLAQTCKSCRQTDIDRDHVFGKVRKPWQVRPHSTRLKPVHVNPGESDFASSVPNTCPLQTSFRVIIVNDLKVMFEL